MGGALVTDRLANTEKNPLAFPINYHFCGATTRSQNVPEYNGGFFSLVCSPDLVISCRVVKTTSASSSSIAILDSFQDNWIWQQDPPKGSWLAPPPQKFL